MKKWDIGFWPTKTDAVYRSRLLQPNEISGPCRILLRRNKYHHKGDKLPVYIGHIVSEETEDQVQNMSLEENVSMLKQLIVEANEASATVRNAADSAAIANDYWREIIRQVEEITGEKIDIKVWGPLPVKED